MRYTYHPECSARKRDIYRNVTQEVLAQESSFQTTIVDAFPFQTKYANTNMMRNSGTNDDLLSLKHYR